MADLGISNVLDVEGNIAHGSTDSGSPLKIGGKASSTTPTAVTTGQRADAWFGLNGQQSVMIVDSAGANVVTGTQYAEASALGTNGTGTLIIARRTDTLATLTPTVDQAVSAKVNSRGALWVTLDGTATAFGDAIANPNIPLVGALTVGFNGTTHDRLRTIDGYKTAAASPDLGILATYAPDRRYTSTNMSGTAVNSTATWDVQAANAVLVYITATTTGTIRFDVSADGTNYTPAEVYDVIPDLWASGASVVPTAGKVYRIETYGWRNMRAIVTATLGSAAIGLVATMTAGSPIINAIDAGPAPHAIGYSPLALGAQFTTAQTSAALGPTVAATQKMVVTALVIEAAGTVAATQITVYFGTGAYVRGTNKALYDGSAKPSTTLVERIMPPVPPTGWVGALDEELRITNVGAVNPLTVTAWYYLVG